MINISTKKKSAVAKELSNIISKVCTLKFERECELSSQQRKDLDEVLILLRNVLAKTT